MVDHRPRGRHQHDPDGGEREPAAPGAPRAGGDEHQADRDLGGRLRVRARERRERVLRVDRGRAFPGEPGLQRGGEHVGEDPAEQPRGEVPSTPADHEPDRDDDAQRHHDRRPAPSRSNGSPADADRVGPVRAPCAATRRRVPAGTAGHATSDATAIASTATAASIASADHDRAARVADQVAVSAEPFAWAVVLVHGDRPWMSEGVATVELRLPRPPGGTRERADRLRAAGRRVWARRRRGRGEQAPSRPTAGVAADAATARMEARLEVQAAELRRLADTAAVARPRGRAAACRRRGRPPRVAGAHRARAGTSRQPTPSSAR